VFKILFPFLYTLPQVSAAPFFYLFHSDKLNIHMKQQTKSDSQNAKKSTTKKDQPNAKQGTGSDISTNSSKEDKNKPKRLGESETEITDETTI
jgi:hypothetical protein